MRRDRWNQARSTGRLHWQVARSAAADVHPEGPPMQNIQIDRLHVDHNLAANDAKSAK
jgi:hypothetical protein